MTLIVRSKLSHLGIAVAVVALTLSFFPTKSRAVAKCNSGGGQCQVGNQVGSCQLGTGQSGICMCYIAGQQYFPGCQAVIYPPPSK